ncbi:MAG: DMT family transporter [Candidatus Tectomicrobia bacterium]|nr:DMT family transporter [Candidatus Tectomicrobia bacterium]
MIDLKFLKYALCPFLSACLWGGMYVVSKIGFAEIPPITLAVLRLSLGGGALWILLTLQPHRPSVAREDRKSLFLLGFFVACTLVTQFIGTDIATAHEGALLTTTTPIFVVAIAPFLLKERVTVQMVSGALLGFLGVILVIAGEGSLSGFRSATSWLGSLLLLASALFWGLFTLFGKPVVRRYSPLVASTYGALSSLPFLLPLLPWELSIRPILQISAAGIFSILYLGLASTSLAWYLWYKGLEQLDAGLVSIFFFIQPLVGGLLSWLILGEEIGMTFILGGIAIALGILLASGK